MDKTALMVQRPDNVDTLEVQLACLSLGQVHILEKGSRPAVGSVKTGYEGSLHGLI